MFRMSLFAFLELQKDRIKRIGRATPHATGPRRPGLVDQDDSPDTEEKDND